MCNELPIRVRGVSFSVGSSGVAFEAYKDALQVAEEVFKLVDTLGLPQMDLLDIGGGFSEIKNSTNAFSFVAPKLSEHLSNVFPGTKIGRAHV